MDSVIIRPAIHLVSPVSQRIQQQAIASLNTVHTIWAYHANKTSRRLSCKQRHDCTSAAHPQHNHICTLMHEQAPRSDTLANAPQPRNYIHKAPIHVINSSKTWTADPMLFPCIRLHSDFSFLIHVLNLDGTTTPSAQLAPHSTQKAANPC